MTRRQLDDDVTFVGLVFQRKQKLKGGHRAAWSVGARVIEMAQVPVDAGLSRVDVEQVGTSTHGAQQMWAVVVIIARDRRASPSTLKVGCLGLAARLLRMAIDASHRDIDLASTQLLFGVRL